MAFLSLSISYLKLVRYTSPGVRHYIMAAAQLPHSCIPCTPKYRGRNNFEDNCLEKETAKECHKTFTRALQYLYGLLFTQGLPWSFNGVSTVSVYICQLAVLIYNAHFFKNTPSTLLVGWYFFSRKETLLCNTLVLGVYRGCNKIMQPPQ